MTGDRVWRGAGHHGAGHHGAGHHGLATTGLATTGLAAGLILLAAGAATDLVAGPRRPAWRTVPYLAGAAGSACLAVAGAAAVSGQQVALRTGGLLGAVAAGAKTAGTVPAGSHPLFYPAGALAADRLSGLFLLIAFAAATAVSLAFASWAAGPDRPARRGLGAGYALALGSVAVVLTARDVFTFLFGWESLTLAFWVLAGFRRHAPGRPAAALVTLAFGRISGAFLLAGMLLLVTRSGSLTLAGLAQAPAGRAGPPRSCCCWPGSRSRWAWCPSRSGFPAAMPPRRARPAPSWPGSR